MKANGKSWLLATGEVVLLVAFFFAVAGIAPPGINEAHYLAKSKNYWDPTWCARDIFVSSGNPHLLFHLTFGAFTRWLSLESTAWIGRMIGWLIIAIGLRAVTVAITDKPLAVLAVALIWIGGVHGFNLAGEWVIGGIEGKVPAYGFVLLALRMMIVGKWRFVWPLFGIASAFHVLVGGWSVIAAMLVFWRYGWRETTLRSQCVPLLVGGFFAAIGIYPAIDLTFGDARETVTAAARIYSYERLTHHLLPSSLELEWYVRHGVLVLLTGLAFWMLRDDDGFVVVRMFTIGAVAIAMLGLLIGTLPPYEPDLAAKLLRYYWFRMTDAVVPLGLALAWVRLPMCIRYSRTTQCARVIVFVVAFWTVVAQTIETNRLTVVTDTGRVVSAVGMNTRDDNRKQVLSDWLAVCEWVDRTLPQDEVLLTPRNQHSFKWYANRAEVVNWKDVPQDADRLLEWSHRFYDVFPLRLGTVRVTVRYQDLIRYRKEYGARFMIVDRRFSGESLPLVQVYPLSPYESNATYGVYRLP
jgi:hypothetical protein